MKNKWYKSKGALVSLHVFTWVLFFTFPMLFRRESPLSKDTWDHLTSRSSFIFDFICILLFYVNANLLIPRLLNKRKPLIYIAVLVLLFLFSFFLISITKSGINGPHHHGEPDFMSLFFPFMFIWAMSTAYRFVTDQVKTEQLLKERENENLKTELAFLRSQVSPHFLFNVLNNMVGMARLKSDLLEPSLIRLSELMRYMLYESDEEKVPLNKEIGYVKSFIELQKIRFAKNLTIHADLNEVPGHYLIEPMLLIPFIENAFKHGTGMIEKPVIDISLSVHNGQLDFRVVNAFNNDSIELKDKTSGIGLANVIRRLNLLYDKKHLLAIDKKNDSFAVSLQLKLHE